MDIITILIKDIYTKSEVQQKLRAVTDYFNLTLYGSGRGSETPPDEAIAPLVSKLLPKKDKKAIENLKDNLPKAVKTLEQIPPVVLYLPFELPEANLKEIALSLRAILPNALLEIKYSTFLIAGCALSYRGIYKDYSIKAKLGEKREEIEKLLFDLNQKTNHPTPINTNIQIPSPK